MNNLYDKIVKKNSTTNYPKPIFQNKRDLSFSIKLKLSLSEELLEESIFQRIGPNCTRQIFRSKLGFCDFLKYFLIFRFELL